MSAPPLAADEIAAVVATVDECVAQGFARPDAPMVPGRRPSALSEAARRLGIDRCKVRRCWIAAHPRKGDGRLADDVVQLPDPKTITKVSTLYDRYGDISAQWVQERPQDAKRLEAWSEAAKELAHELPRAAPVAFRRDGAREELLALFPVGDHHINMLAWPEETGGPAWDLAIAEHTLNEAMADLVTSVPSCGHAAVVFLGDLMHQDGYIPVTPAHGHQLDADGRFPKIVRAAIRMIRRAIELVAEHHAKVTVVIAAGNHDPVSSVFLREALANVYENNSRITVDTSPRPFHFLRHGKCFIGVHHGDRVKLEDLPLLMATDRPRDWGETQHRVWFTGHRHSRQVIERGGCLVEVMRVLPPTDAYAAGHGYRSQREMHAIVYHAEHGERIRHTYRP